MFEKNMKFPILLDTYGSLLTDRKREILDYYYNEDYSLAEISEITGISRQGVRDSIKKSEEELFQLEEKLGLADKNERILRASQILDEITQESSLDKSVRNAIELCTEAAERSRKITHLIYDIPKWGYKCSQIYLKSWKMPLKSSKTKENSPKPT